MARFTGRRPSILSFPFLKVRSITGHSYYYSDMESERDSPLHGRVVVGEMLYRVATNSRIDVAVTKEVVTTGHSRVEELMRLIDMVESWMEGHTSI